MVKNTQYCYVGNYICYRNRSQKSVWITQVKETGSDISVDDFENSDDLYTKKESTRLNVALMLERRDDLEYIQMTEVPKGYFTTIAGRTGRQLQFYDNLLQITMRAHGMIFCLDTR